MEKKPVSRIIYIVALLAISVILGLLLINGITQDRKLASKEDFYKLLDAGNTFYSVTVAPYQIEGTYDVYVAQDKASAADIFNRYTYTFTIDSNEYESFKAMFESHSAQFTEKALRVEHQPEQSVFVQMLPSLLVIGVMVVLMVVFLRRMQDNTTGKAQQFTRAATNVYDGKNKIGFDMVAGADEEKAELSEIVEFLRNPKQFTDMGARIPKGVLLVGAPGTGKTLLARAVAGEAGVPFYSITGSDFVELYVGVGASRVRDLFSQAKRTAPCIIFIDEIDAVGRHRGAGLGGGHDEREQTLNQLLTEMDGFSHNEGIVVMAATNRADILDPALLRPGRFDRRINVMLPDVKGREEIFKVHARNKKLAPDVNPHEIAQLTVGFSGADMEMLLNEAALLAVHKHQKSITNQDIKDSLTKVIMGPEKKSRTVTEQSRRLTAYHEAGHAVLAHLLPGCDEVSEISIIGRGGAGGYTMTRPDKDTVYLARNVLLDDICMGLGGRVAEEICQADISSGARGDIKHITQLAHAMVTEYGMYDKIGPLYLGDGDEIFIGRDFSARKSFSDSWSARIDDAVHDIIDTQLERARTLLMQNRALLEAVATALLEREKLSGEEFKLILDGKPLPERVPAEQPVEQQTAQNEQAPQNTEPQSTDGQTKTDKKDDKPSDDPTAPPRFF